MVLSETEINLVNKGIELEMREIREGKIRVKGIAQIKKKYRL